MTDVVYQTDDLLGEFGCVGERELAVGDELVVLGASALSDGAPIQILERRAAGQDSEDGHASEEVAAASEPE